MSAAGEIVRVDAVHRIEERVDNHAVGSLRLPTKPEARTPTLTLAASVE